MTKYSCDNSPIIDLVERGIKHLEFNSNHDPSKKLSLYRLRKAFKIYKKDCALCKGKADNDVTCLDAALTKLYRQIPFIKDSIYPWENYEWDYTNFVDNNYSAKATGSTKKGSWSALRKNTKIFFKLFKALIFDANPNKYSRAGGTNKYSDYPIYECQGNNKKNCKIWNKVKMSNKQGKPYNSSFFNKKLTGEHSSSYYAKVGVCPRKDLKNSKDCIKNGHSWIPNKMIPENGHCFQDRYMYINNTPGYAITTKKIAKLATPNRLIRGIVPKYKLGKIKGYLPSVTNDMSSLSPGKLFKAFTGNSVDGHMSLQKCPELVENYSAREEKTDFLKIISILIVVFFILYYIRFLLH